jgi:RHS repeat-associated protein
VPDYYTTTTATFRIVSDHLGSPRLVVNTATGSVVEQIGYDEFGNMTSDTAPGTIPFGFAGGLYDKDTGLVRFGARDYDASVGRWASKDPIRFNGGQINLYVYAGNDPVNTADPNGMLSDNCFQSIVNGCEQGCQSACSPAACVDVCLAYAYVDETLHPGAYGPECAAKKKKKNTCTCLCDMREARPPYIARHANQTPESCADLCGSNPGVCL